jgi:SanA protein
MLYDAPPMKLPSLKRSLQACILAVLILGLSGFGINLLMLSGTENMIFTKTEDVPTKQAALVLGARVYSDERPSPILEDRLATALELYQAKKVQKLLVSGDHGRANYDEVRAMRNYFTEHGVPAADIFMDHAGFDTYDSVYRARDVFQAKSLIIVTQEFHLPRALYIAKRLGVDAAGIVADRREYTAGATRRNTLREPIARIKAFGSVTFGAKPRYLGEPAPLTGDGTVTDDRKTQSEQ